MPAAMRTVEEPTPNKPSETLPSSGEPVPLSGSLGTDIQTFVSKLVRDKEVLDVGCADHSAAQEVSPRWLHKHIARSARYTLGLDLAQSEIIKLRERGYNVIQEDATTVELGRQFEVIVAGEIIEHIENPGAFLRNMRRHLSHDGQLVLTTPNPFFVLHWSEWLVLNSRLRQRWNHQHVAWYDPFTLANLLERCGLRVEATYYFARSRSTLKTIQLLRWNCPRLLAASFVTLARPM